MTLCHCGARIRVGLAKCNEPESRQPWLDEGSGSVSSLLSGSRLGCSSQFLAYVVFSSPPTSSSPTDAGVTAALLLGMQIDNLGINTGDRLLLATKLPSASLVNADGNLSLLQF